MTKGEIQKGTSDQKIQTHVLLIFVSCHESWMSYLPGNVFGMIIFQGPYAHSRGKGYQLPKVVCDEGHETSHLKQMLYCKLATKIVYLINKELDQNNQIVI